MMMNQGFVPFSQSHHPIDGSRNVQGYIDRRAEEDVKMPHADLASLPRRLGAILPEQSSSDPP